MPSSINFSDPESVLSLENLRNEVRHMEDLIIFKFIERSKLPQCNSIYNTKLPEINNLNTNSSFDGTFLDLMLIQTERFHSQMRRYQSPEEVPFFPNEVLDSVLPPLSYPQILHTSKDSNTKTLNLNDWIKDLYIKNIIPLICRNEADKIESHGSAAVLDIECLQLLSTRIHFGKYFAECKYKSNEELYNDLIKANDHEGILNQITDRVVEDKIFDRLILKSQAYSIDSTNVNQVTENRNMPPESIVNIYKNVIFPITKEVMVEYLLSRLD